MSDLNHDDDIVSFAFIKEFECPVLKVQVLANETSLNSRLKDRGWTQGAKR